MTKCNRQSLEVGDEYRGYSYEKEREMLFNEEGFKLFIRVRDRAKELLKEGGAFTIAGIMRKIGGDDWDILACADMLVELGEIEEVKRERDGQYRTFVEKGC